MAKKKILHVISSLGRGGAENILEMICRHDNNEHIVICLGTKLDRKKTIEDAGGRIIGFDGSLKKAITYKFDFAPDVIVGWMYHGNLIASHYKKFHHPQSRLIWSIRQGLDNWKTLKVQTQLVIRACRWISSQPDLITYNGKASQKQHESFGYNSSRSHYLPNGVNTDIFTVKNNPSLREQLDIPESATVIIQAARLTPEKNYPLFFSVTSKLLQKYENLHIICIGENMDSTNRGSLIETLGLNTHQHKRIHLLGQQTSTQDYLQLADIYFSSSETEAFSNSILEAMSTGLAIVSTQAGDSREILGDTGKIRTLYDNESLEKDLEDFILKPLMRKDYGRRARERAEEHFSIKTLIHNFKNLL